ncbi:hypothetical protein [Hemidactylus frenatus papillomavirus]|uniref:Uncharacterized protein n=1 Tax=Hemidactylus frenatus papillomavirus TaxID=2588389 RepID=A0A5P1KK53_9PAPI|nr:hypothetical protein [Hemidactylus frenatus papillomavirus]
MGMYTFLSVCQLPVWGAFFCNSPMGEYSSPDGDNVLRNKAYNVYIILALCELFSPVRETRARYSPRRGRGACTDPSSGRIGSPTGEEAITPPRMGRKDVYLPNKGVSKNTNILTRLPTNT